MRVMRAEVDESYDVTLAGGCEISESAFDVFGKITTADKLRAHQTWHSLFAYIVARNPPTDGTMPADSAGSLPVCARYGSQPATGEVSDGLFFGLVFGTTTFYVFRH